MTEPASTETAPEPIADDIPEPTAADYDAAAASVRGDQADTDGSSTGDEEPAKTDEPDDTKIGAEAAKYRKRLRATEAERDALTTRLETLQRGEVQRLVGNQLADANDFWRDGAKLADLLDADGNVDPTKVTAATDGLLKAHPHWAPQRFSPTTLGSRSGSGSSASAPPVKDPWVKAFSPRES